MGLWRRILGAALLLKHATRQSFASESQRMEDRVIVEQSKLAAVGEHVDIYSHNGVNCSALREMADAAYVKLERLTGRRFDTKTLGGKVRIYVSDAVHASHVWNGYAHPSDPRGVVLLSARAYTGAVAGNNATYAHEMVHLLMWRYTSHTLREGLADYLALMIHPRAGVGPNALGLGGSRPRPSDEVLEYLGTSRSPPLSLLSEPAFRRSYYHASYQFTKFLVEAKGIDTFLRLYDSDDPERGFVTLYRATRSDLVRLAFPVG